MTRGREVGPAEWNIGRLLKVLNERVYFTCDVSDEAVEMFLEGLRFELSRAGFELYSVGRAKGRSLTKTKLAQLEKAKTTISNHLGKDWGRTVSAWIETAKYGKARNKDALGQGVLLISNRLKAARVPKSYYWSVLLLAHGGSAPHGLLGVTEDEVAEFPKAPRSGAKKLPELPSVGQTSWTRGSPDEFSTGGSPLAARSASGTSANRHCR